MRDYTAIIVIQTTGSVIQCLGPARVVVCEERCKSSVPVICYSKPPVVRGRLQLYAMLMLSTSIWAALECWFGIWVHVRLLESECSQICLECENSHIETVSGLLYSQISFLYRYDACFPASSAAFGMLSAAVHSHRLPPAVSSFFACDRNRPQ